MDFPEPTQTHQHDELTLVDLQRGVSNGGDVAALLDGGQVGLTVMGRQELFGIRPVELPDVPAGELGLVHRVEPRRGTGGPAGRRTLVLKRKQRPSH